MKILLLITFCVNVSTCAHLFTSSVDDNTWNDLQLVISKSNISSQCAISLHYYLSAIQKTYLTEENDWVLQMLDATAKQPSGMLYGSLVNFGNYDQCLAITHPKDSFVGKYCLLDVQVNIDDENNTYFRVPRFIETFFQSRLKENWAKQKDLLQISWGLCVPSVCNQKDLTTVLSSVSEMTGTEIQANTQCSTREKRKFSSASTAFLTMLGLLGILALLSTTYEVLFASEENSNPYLTAFSLVKNTKTLLEVSEKPTAAEDMRCLQAIRVISLMWVVLYQTDSLLGSAPATVNIAEKLETIASLRWLVPHAGIFAIDTFLLLSGLEVSYAFFKKINRKGFFDVPASFLHNYVSVAPALILVLIFYATLMEDLGDGPLFLQRIGEEKQRCLDHWWHVLLYLGNILSPTNPCMNQSWYLAVDMQLFWASPLILIPLYLRPRVTRYCIVGMTIATTLITYVHAEPKAYRATLLAMRIWGGVYGENEQRRTDYNSPILRMIPWLVGVLLGYGMSIIRKRNATVSLTKVHVALGWIVATAIRLAVLLEMGQFLGDFDISIADNALYLSASRLGWGVSVAWVIFACVYGYGGVVNKFLTLEIFQPLAKLSYGVFLTHAAVLIYRLASMRSSIYLSEFDILCHFISTLIFSYLPATALYLLVQQPIANIEKMLLQPLKIYPLYLKRNMKEASGATRNKLII